MSCRYQRKLRTGGGTAPRDSVRATVGVAGYRTKVGGTFQGVGNVFSVWRYASVALRPSGRRMKTRNTDLPAKTRACSDAIGVGRSRGPVTHTHGPAGSNRSGGRNGSFGLAGSNALGMFGLHRG